MNALEMLVAALVQDDAESAFGVELRSVLCPMRMLNRGDHQRAVERFSEYFGRESRASDLVPQRVSAFLQSLELGFSSRRQYQSSLIYVEDFLAECGLAVNRFSRVLSWSKSPLLSDACNKFLASKTTLRVKRTHYPLVCACLQKCLQRAPTVSDLNPRTIEAFRRWLLADCGLSKGTVSIYVRVLDQLSESFPNPRIYLKSSVDLID